jgi:hypothetical protein
MKKYIVYFLEEFGGELSQQKTVLAETKEDALDKYLLENYSEKYRLIMVSPTAFFSTPQVFNNPIYQKNKKEIIESDKEQNKSDESFRDEREITNSNRSVNSNSEKLDRLIELQEKQLYWIRFLGVVTLISLITAFVYILIAVSIGRTRY